MVNGVGFPAAHWVSRGGLGIRRSLSDLLSSGDTVVSRVGPRRCVLAGTLPLSGTGGWRIHDATGLRFDLHRLANEVRSRRNTRSLLSYLAVPGPHDTSDLRVCGVLCSFHGQCDVPVAGTRTETQNAWRDLPST